MKISQFLARAAEQLSERHIPDPYIEAEVLLRHVLGMKRAELFVASDEALTSHQEERVRRFLRRRLEGEPLAYIVGHREFYGLDFVIDRHVLIPRQETELLVDRVLEYARSRPGEDLRIVDVGTGSGALAVAIARQLPRATLYATDVSRQALLVADVNRRRHGVSNRVHLCQGDLLEALGGSVDIIVSNPPYIRTGEMAHLGSEVRREPPRALDGGADGLDVTRSLLQQVPARLYPGGLVLVEISPEQRGEVKRMAQEVIPGASVSSAKDLLGLPRVLIVELGGRGMRRVGAALDARLSEAPF